MFSKDDSKGSVSEKVSTANIRLNLIEKMALILFIILFAIYTLFVAWVIFLSPLNITISTVIGVSYAIIAPTILYFMWFMFCYRKLKKWPNHISFLGGKFSYLLLFFLLGMCVVAWAKYWNSGIDYIWFAAAILVLFITRDVFGANLYYNIGSIAISPPLVEEFLKSFPCIIAFFVVLQRKRNSQQKGKGLLGNELFGLIVGIMIGIAFQILELILYVILILSSNGTIFDIFFQVTLRNWAPIHILGGATGGYAAGRAERIRFEKQEENLPLIKDMFKFIKRFLPFWAIPVLVHFSWNFLQVMISLIFITLNITNIWLYIGIDVLLLIIFFFICISIITVFFNRANRVTEQSYRCSNTGMFVLEKDLTCEPISESITSSPDESIISSTGSAQQQKYCYNCGASLIMGYRFCTNCGAEIPVLDYTINKKEYNPKKFVHIFLIISMIIGSVFIVVSLIIHGLFLFMKWEGLFGYLFNISTDIVGALTIVFSAYFLLRNEKRYSGKHNVWCWLLLFFNYIGLMFSCLLMGIGFIISNSLSILIGYGSSLIITIFGFLMIAISGAMLVLIIFFFLKRGTQYLLHYQRKE